MTCHRLQLLSALLATSAAAAIAACGSSTDAASPNGVTGPTTDGGAESCAVDCNGDAAAAADGSQHADSSPPALPSGSIDPTFGAAGVATLPLSYFDTVTLASDDSVLLGLLDGATRHPFVTKLSPAGVLDATYGAAGSVALDVTRVDEVVSALANSGGVLLGVSSDTIKLVGDATNALGFGVVRLGPTGAPAPAFGAGGYTGTKPVLSPEHGENFRANALVEESDGSVLAAGFGQRTAGYGDAVFARWKPDGTLDATFGTGGVTVLTYGENTSAFVVGLAPTTGSMHLAIMRFSGSFSSEINETRVLRVTSAGTLDTSFGASGMATALQGTGFADYAVALRSGGFVLVDNDGSFGPPGSPPPTTLSPTGTIARLLPLTGVLDPSFGSGGILAPAPLAAACPASSVAVDSKDRLLVLRHCAKNDAITRLLPSGTLDLTFGTSGVVTTTLSVDRIAVDGKDRVVVAGRPSAGPDGGAATSSVVARFVP